MSASNKIVFIIMGPTASGKTTLAISLAKRLHTDIISADSRQCFNELTIGVARPSKEELSSVTHHFIASHSIHEQVDVAVFENEALNNVSSIFERKDHAVVCGGTGLYINAFCTGIDEMPIISKQIREEVKTRWENEGIQGLKGWLMQIDPLFMAQSNEQNNRVRLMRALEVMLSSGQSILEFQKGSIARRPFQIKKIFIDWPREILYKRINQRVEGMMEQGLLDEARSMYPYRHLKALQTVGYQELFDYLDGKMSLELAVDKIKQHTRNYAKRQITWFKKQGWDITISGDDLENDSVLEEMIRT